MLLSGLVWSPSHLDPSHNLIPSHPTPSHPSQSTYPIPYSLTSFLFYLTLSHPTPSDAIPPIPFHLAHPTLFSVLPVLPYPVPSHSISPHQTHPIPLTRPPTSLFPPVLSHLSHCPPPHPHLLGTSMPFIPRQSCSCQGHWWAHWCWRPLGALPYPGCVSVKAETK